MFDYSGMSDDDLAHGLDQLHALESATRARRLAMVAEYARRQAWKADGAASMGEWLATRHGVRRRTGEEWARVASALRKLPAIAERAADGRLSEDKVAAVTRVATCADDDWWAEEAEMRTAASLTRTAARCRDRSADAEDGPRRRLSTWWHPRRGTLRLSGELPAEEGALVKRALELGAESVPPDPETGAPQAYEARCAEALVGLVRNGMAVERDPDRATIVVHVDGDLIAGGDGTAEIAGGPAISSETLHRLACDARWQYVAHGPDGATIGIGRTSRNIPASLAREVMRRYDHMCAFPGCERTIFLEIHHVVPFAQGGRTDLDNLIPLCWSHHSTFHQPGWGITRRRDGRLIFRRRDGREIRTIPPPLRHDVQARMLGPDPPAMSI